MQDVLTVSKCFLAENPNFDSIEIVCNNDSMDEQNQGVTLSQPPTSPVPMQPNLDKQGLSFLKWIWVIVVMFLVLLIGGLFVFSYVSKRHTAYAPTITPVPTQGSGIPQPKKTTDLAPSIPNSQKTVVIIENNDSSLEKVIMPTSQVVGYIKTLPEGVRVISQSPAGQ